MSLQEQIYELFLLDKTVRGLSSRLDAATRRQSVQQTRLDQLTRQRDEIVQQHTHSKTKAASLEHQSQDIDQKIDSHRQQMNTASNNKQYSALLLEVSTLKDQKSKLEDEALEQLSTVDELAGRQTEIEEKIAQQKKLTQQSQDEVNQAKTQVGDKLDQAQAQRDQAAANVPAEALHTFEILIEEYDGQAMAQVEEADRKRMEYNCGGCYIALPIERINSLMTKANELVTCPNCLRILYMDSQLKDSFKS